jgi:hypothetical protein
MINNDKSYYIKNIPKNIPIFFKPFYLDAVCGKDWSVLSYISAGKAIAFFFFYKEKGNITMPVLCPYQGPWFVENLIVKRILSTQKKILTSFIQHITNCDEFVQHWHYNNKNWLPFYWKGYGQISRYTYTLDPFAVDGKELLGLLDMKSNLKREIRKAALSYKIFEVSDLDNYYKLVENTFRRKKMNPIFSKESLNSVYKACKDNNCCKVLIAKNSDSKPVAGIFLVEDDLSVYYLSGAIGEFDKEGIAMKLLIYNSIKYSFEKNKVFDFEGSVIESIESLFRSFGAEQKGYFRVSKINLKSRKVKNKLRELLALLKE